MIRFWGLNKKKSNFLRNNLSLYNATNREEVINARSYQYNLKHDLIPQNQKQILMHIDYNLNKVKFVSYSRFLTRTFNKAKNLW
jgi:hypothetical protein